MENLIDLFQAKTTTKEFKTPNFSFKLRTLTADELTEVLRRADILSTSNETRVFVAKKLTLAYALESVNGVDVLALPEIAKLRANPEFKDSSKVELLLPLLGAFDADIIEDLYQCYNNALDENTKQRAELKKALVAR